MPVMPEETLFHPAQQVIRRSSVPASPTPAHLVTQTPYPSPATVRPVILLRRQLVHRYSPVTPMHLNRGKEQQQQTGRGPRHQYLSGGSVGGYGFSLACDPSNLTLLLLLPLPLALRLSAMHTGADSCQFMDDEVGAWSDHQTPAQHQPDTKCMSRMSHPISHPISLGRGLNKMNPSCVALLTASSFP